MRSLHGRFWTGQNDGNVSCCLSALRRTLQGEVMWLIVVYVVIALVGEFIAVELGLYLDKVYPALAVPIALALFFGVLVLAFPPAVWITKRWFVSQSK